MTPMQKLNAVQNPQIGPNKNGEIRDLLELEIQVCRDSGLQSCYED